MSAVSATAIGASERFTCVVVTGGGVKCWGRNANGQLGSGSNVPDPQKLPVDVMLGTGVYCLNADSAEVCHSGRVDDGWGQEVPPGLALQSQKKSRNSLTGCIGRSKCSHCSVVITRPERSITTVHDD